MTAEPAEIARLQSVRSAFDSVAEDYDGDMGNNHVIQGFRSQLWKAVESAVPVGSHLLDIGCGTGLDAVHFARLGYQVTGVDWSPEMVARTARRITELGLDDKASSVLIGVHELTALSSSRFDAIYSDLGPLNCAPDLWEIASVCARLLRPGGSVIASVMGRICPWEILYYLALGNPRRAMVRFSNKAVPVPLNGQTVWTWYYTPAEFFKPFANEFTLTSCRALGLFAPPPYLIGAWRRAERACAAAAHADATVGGWAGLRNAGDHFLMTMRLSRHQELSN